MSYLQLYIQECLMGNLSVEELKSKLHSLIDDVIIPDVIFMLNDDFTEVFKEGE